LSGKSHGIFHVGVFSIFTATVNRIISVAVRVNDTVFLLVRWIPIL